MMNVKRIFNIILSFACAIFCLSGAIYAAEVVDRIVAVVNDDIITQSELDESMLPFVADYRLRYGEENLKDKIDEARSDALNRLIEEKLILQHAKRKEIEAKEGDVEERIQQAKSKFETEEEFYRVLEEVGMSMAKLRKKYEEQAMMKELIATLINVKVRISPTQISAYYHGHQEDFSKPKMVRFKILLLKPLPDRNMSQTEELALQIIGKVRSGEDFDLLVKEYSQGPNTDKGGDMGYMPEGSIIRELEDAISVLSPGEISGLIKTTVGFNVIKLIDKKEAEVIPFSEVEDNIRERLFQREAELTLREFIDKLKEDAYIKIQ